MLKKNYNTTQKSAKMKYWIPHSFRRILLIIFHFLIKVGRFQSNSCLSSSYKKEDPISGSSLFSKFYLCDKGEDDLLRISYVKARLSGLHPTHRKCCGTPRGGQYPPLHDRFCYWASQFATWTCSGRRPTSRHARLTLNSGIRIIHAKNGRSL